MAYRPTDRLLGDAQQTTSGRARARGQGSQHHTEASGPGPGPDWSLASKLCDLEELFLLSEL